MNRQENEVIRGGILDALFSDGDGFGRSNEGHKQNDDHDW